MIQKQTAVVYFGGGRRFFTKKAAIRNEAKQIFKAHFDEKCECESGDEFHSPYTCKYHMRDYFEKFIRRTMRLIPSIPKSEQKEGEK